MRRLLLVSLFLTLPYFTQAQEVVNFYNWSDYMPQAILDQFTQETGIQVVYTTYESNEEMYDTLKGLQSRYDIAVPSTYFVSRLIRDKMIQPLDKKKLPGLRNLYRALLGKSADPANKYSVPYLWGTTGIAVDAKKINPAKVKRWSDLWAKEYRGKILMIDDMREVMHVGLRALGYSSNSLEPRELRAAAQMLGKLTPHVKVWDSETPKDHFLSGEVAIGMLWNGEAYLANKQNPNIQYIYPEEGAVMWMDNMVIPVGAQNPDGAHKLMEFLLRPEVAKALSEGVGYATPNKAAMKLLDPDVRNNPIAYPPEVALENAEFTYDVGDALQYYEREWAKLRGE